MTKGRGEATKSLQVEVLDDIERARPVVADWNDLGEELGASPFALPAFALAWWEHLGRGRLWIATVRDGSGRLVGLAPFHVRRLGGLDVVRWLGHGLGAVSELLVRPTKGDVAACIWSTLADRRRCAIHLIEYRHAGAGLAQLRRAEAWDVRAVLADSFGNTFL